MTAKERKAFMRQFDLARRQVKRLAKLYPDCFDKNGRAIIATLRSPQHRSLSQGTTDGEAQG